MRSIFLDFDSRPEPKTDRWCVKCQRDIKPGRPARIVRVLEAQVLHPDDAGGAGEEYLIGLDCATQLGLEWSRPER
jgi:hypothetical protein